MGRRPGWRRQPSHGEPAHTQTSGPKKRFVCRVFSSAARDGPVARPSVSFRCSPSRCSGIVRRRASIAARSPSLGVALAQHGAARTPSARTSTMLKLPDVKITDATAVPAATTGAIRAAHCRVNGVIGGDIQFSLLLPDEWNRKFVMGGGGGFVGGIENQARASVNAGYATVGTDTGHKGGITDASWALNNPERQVNFGYLAVHRTAEVAKAIVRSYYGANEARSYFSGCSNGGRQALMEAQRYPDDFDGIVAGAPAYDFTGIGAQFIKDIQAAFPDPRDAVDADVHARGAEIRRGADRREVRRARRRERRPDGGSARVQGRRRVADRADRRAAHRAQDDLRRDAEQGRRDLSGAAGRRRRRARAAGRRGSPASTPSCAGAAGAERCASRSAPSCSSTSSSTIRRGTTRGTSSRTSGRTRRRPRRS